MPDSTLLLERDSELKVLLQQTGSAQRGQGRVVLLGGEAGIGKSSLLNAYVRNTRSGVRVLWGGCEALFTPRPLGPIQDMAQSLDPQLAELLAQGVPLSVLFPAILRALRIARVATVLIFEDVHWADHGTLDLIKYLGRRIGVLPALLILSFRPDEMGPGHPLAQVLGDLPSNAATRLTLEPLSTVAVAQMAHAAGRPEAHLHAITGGNPFFVTELLASGGKEGAPLPASIKDAVLARLSRLSAPERHVVETMSVDPSAIERWLIDAVLGPDAERAIEDLVSRGFLRRDNDAFKFHHELARQATLAQVPHSTQRQLHAKFEAAIAARAPDQTNAALARQVLHAAGAEDSARVLEYAPKAARQAAQLGAHREAAAYLATALQFAGAAPRALAAQLNEDWAYEAGLALGIDDKVIAARVRAIDLWRGENRVEKVGHNLRWLSRLHWYRGEAEKAGRYIDEAIGALETIAPGAELAMAYSARSQLHMLNDHMDEAIDWGKRAIDLAKRLGEADTRAHALNNVGTALLFSGRQGGREMLEESLAIALEHEFHEHAARAYTNLAEYAVVFKDFALAERTLADGIAFDTRHDLDSWTHYLVGRQAQLRMEQGRLREAETIARGVLGLDRLTLVMRLPALTVLAKVRTRLGEADGGSLLQQALGQAMATSEPQRIVPLRFALVEAAWLADDGTAAAQALADLEAMDIANFDPWELGELATWRRRLGRDGALPATQIPEPRAAELRGDVSAAADEWLRLGVPYEAGLALAQSRGPDSDAAFARAVTLLDDIEAKPAAARVRDMARDAGAAEKLPPARRGPYAVARWHPLGLTKRECEILGLLAEGAGNREIASRLFRSTRTVEHHVSAVLAKLNATNRMEAMLRARSEPWLISASPMLATAEK